MRCTCVYNQTRDCGSGLLSLSVWPDERRSAAAPSIPKLSVEEAAVYEVGVCAQRNAVWSLSICLRVLFEFERVAG